MKILTLGLLTPSLLLCACSRHDSAAPPLSVDSHIRTVNGLNHAASDLLPSPEAIVGQTFRQLIDHGGALGQQTFAQRYWVFNDFAKSADAPVIYHICGEGDVDYSYFLNDSALAWAKTLGARVVFLEHRYYGQSQPFTDLSTEHLRYLSLNNVIEDLAYFQRAISKSQGWKGKWISVGGSYSGTLSALYRQRHPELVVGALASSAPMISGLGDETGTDNDVSDLAPTDLDSERSDRQWTYQACTDLGFWLAEGPSFDAGLQRPSPWLCQQIFGNTPLVNPAQYNLAYDTPFITNSANAPSNILFTYGSEDVWTRTGLLQQTNQNSKITVRLIQGAVHHYDLNAAGPEDNDDVVQARSEFINLARGWLNN